MANVTFTPQELDALLSAKMPGVVCVPPSGDTSGDTDTKNIQDAIDSNYTNNDQATRAIVLGSNYFLNHGLYSGYRLGGSTTLNPPCILGVPHATLIRVGEPTDEYMLSMVGGTANTSHSVHCTRLANLRFAPLWKSRGLLVTRLGGYPSFQNIHVTQPVGSGLDAMDCYSSRWDGISITGARGYAARFFQFNGAMLSNLYCGGCQTMWHASGKAEDTAELIKYAMLNGTAAAREYYTTGAGGPNNFLTAWPADDEVLAIGEDMKPVNIKTVNMRMAHAIVSFEGNGSMINNVDFEGCSPIDDPLLYLAGISTQFNTLRHEANCARKCKIRIPGSAGGYALWGHHNHLSNVMVHDGLDTKPETLCESVIEFTGETAANMITGVNARGITEAVVTNNGGKHSGNKIVNVTTNHPVCAAMKREINGATDDILPVP